MLMFLVYIGKERYAIESDLVVEVVPKVALKKMVHVPNYISGLLNYGGTPIPVVDLCQLIDNRPCDNCMHTRILLFKFPDANGHEYNIAFMGEKMTQTIDKERKDFIDSQVRMSETAYLDGILTEASGEIQFIDIWELFKMIKGVLFEQNKLVL